jgi:hypothetical protein
LSAAVALALVLGTTYVCLAVFGAQPLPEPLNLLLFLGVAAAIGELSSARRANKIREEFALLRTEMDQRDGRIYAALVRRVAPEPVTLEIPRPRVQAVAAVPASGLDPKLIQLGDRISRRMVEGE